MLVPTAGLERPCHQRFQAYTALAAGTPVLAGRQYPLQRSTGSARIAIDVQQYLPPDLHLWRNRLVYVQQGRADKLAMAVCLFPRQLDACNTLLLRNQYLFAYSRFTYFR